MPQLHHRLKAGYQTFMVITSTAVLGTLLQIMTINFELAIVHPTNFELAIVHPTGRNTEMVALAFHCPTMCRT
jgi:hypothetical protein